MARAFSYIVKRDFGFAPNPFYGFLTLATCKQRIRKAAGVGDFIIGNSTVAYGNKLIYMAKVSKVITFDEYWNAPQYEMKKPVMNGSQKKLFGDNIYHHDANGNWIQEDSHHTNDDGTVNEYNLNRDTETTDRVLICDEFIYLGKSMIDVPSVYESCIHYGINHHCPDIAIAQDLWAYLQERYPDGGKIDLPNQFNHFERYNGVS